TPEVGFLSRPGILALREADGPVVFAHSDLSGLSLFEEASYWGSSGSATGGGGRGTGKPPTGGRAGPAACWPEPARGGAAPVPGPLPRTAGDTVSDRRAGERLASRRRHARGVVRCARGRRAAGAGSRARRVPALPRRARRGELRCAARTRRWRCADAPAGCRGWRRPAVWRWR
ncbi:hypothetical protein F3J18_36875, partial [Burkholderia sp. Ax-1720]|nr:hypothetical protein [Burkholderia sp. Ax-1720]